MEPIAELLKHLETLDRRLVPSESLLLQELKLVKEVLLAKHQLCHHLEVPLDSINDDACRKKIREVAAGHGLNIDRINSDYSSTVVCPNCNGTDVALIRHISPGSPGQNYSHHQNRRIKLVQRRSASNSGAFACNGCASSFDPPLPHNVVKLCEMLFRYYF